MNEFEELDDILLDDNTAFQQKIAPDSPETRLARAILVRGFLDVLSKRAKEREEGRRWFENYNTSHPYSFGSIAELLGLAREPIVAWTRGVFEDDVERRRLRMLIGRRAAGSSRHRIGDGPGGRPRRSEDDTVCANVEALLEAV